MALAISRSELLPFSLIIAAFGLFVDFMIGSFPVKSLGKLKLRGWFL